MRLSEMENAAGMAVRRDGDFQTLGFLSDTYAYQLVFLETRAFLRALQRNHSVSAVLTTAELADAVPRGMAVAICDRPRTVFANLHNELALRGFYWEDFPTVIDPSAKVHPTAWIAERNVRIHAASEIAPNATILERCVIGENSIVGAGAVLGGVGFQTVRPTEPMIEMLHAGGLLVESRARILPGAVIATGLFRQNTLISEDARVGSNAFVSHGVQLGRRVFVGHGSVINGNVAVGADSWIGPGAIVSQNLRIGERAFVSLGAVVIRNLAAGARVSGNFAVPHRSLLRMLATMDPRGGR
jgi:UDP-3-O-[3-hydroxymyristoyl] glucosamine N-acyltransferase